MKRFIKNNVVFCVALLAAVVTCFFVPPDAAYADYFDWKTLSCLFLTLAVVCALRNIKFFTIKERSVFSCYSVFPNFTHKIDLWKFRFKMPNGITFQTICNIESKEIAVARKIFKPFCSIS